MILKQFWCENFKGHSYSVDPRSKNYYKCYKCGKEFLPKSDEVRR